MSLNTKKYKNILKKLVDYCKQEQIRFVLCAATTNTKDEIIRQTHLTNQCYIDAIITLGNTFLALLVEESYPDEVVSDFKRSLDKLIDKLKLIYLQKEALKKESKVVARISSFKKGDNA